MNTSHSLLLAKQGLHRSLLSTSGILFLVFYSIIWYICFNTISSEKLNGLADPEAHSLLRGLADQSTLDYLFVNNSPFLSTFFIVILYVTPGFVMWGAGDQTAKDVSSKYLRFLMPRTGRLEIYIGRFLGAIAFTFIVQLSICLVALIFALFIIESDHNIILYSLRIMLGVMIYTTAFVAFMSLLTAITASTAIAVLTAVSFYAIILTISELVSMKYHFLEVLRWLIPSALKDPLLAGDLTQSLMAGIGLLVYSLIYLALGWLVFRSRDI